MKNKRITPFVFAFVLTAILLLIIAIDQTFIHKSGGRALTGILAFIGLIIITILFSIERLIIFRIKIHFLKIWIVEIIVLIVLVILIYKNVLLL